MILNKITYFSLLKSYQKKSDANNIQEQFDFIHLVKMWKRLKKPFNGKFFVDYLRKNAPKIHSALI